MKHVVIDLFCLGGGTTKGVLMALATLNVPATDLEVIAIDHWQVMYMRNRVHAMR